MTTWFHGTPDVRPLRDAGGFTPRFRTQRLVTDGDKLRELSARRSDPEVSGADFRRLSKEMEACWEEVDAPVPVFLSATRATARSYADETRAFRENEADPAVLEAVCDAPAEVTIDARGASFRGVTWPDVAAGLAASDLEAEEVRRTVFDRLPDVRDRIRVEHLGFALWTAGARVVDVENVVDTHGGTGRPDTVRMVFDPELVRLPGLEAAPGTPEP